MPGEIAGDFRRELVWGFASPGAAGARLDGDDGVDEVLCL